MLLRLPRDLHSREYPRAEPENASADGPREPTQSMQIDPTGDMPAGFNADLARGTHNRESTSLESPGAVKRPPPNRPDDYLDRVLGSYRLVELLGKGGMGYVYRAEHIKLGREVALKLLRSDYAVRRDAVARFFQEARTVNRVRHRNIVDVTDFIELDDGTTFIIMELLTGTSLGTWARSGVDLARAIAVLVQICDGLAAAHQVGVVHRDLKPDNVMIVPTGDGAELVKLLDFGVAKLLNRDDEDVGFQTAAGSVIGTPAYMSPEQAGGMPIDARSDIYSLGAIMYELFCGQAMFRGRSFGEYVRKHLTESPMPPRQTAGGVEMDAKLETIILRCVEKDADQRYLHIAELREDLLYLFAGVGGDQPSRPSTSGLAQLPMMPPMGVGYGPYSGMSGQASGSGAGPQVPPSGGYAYDAGASIPSLAAVSSRSVHDSRAGHDSGVDGPPAYTSGQYAAAQPAYDQDHAATIRRQSRPSHPLPARPTPWWVWFVGGALAIGAGTGAAVWYASRDTPDLTPRPAPHVAPVVAQPPAQPAAQPASATRAAPGQPPTLASPHPEIEVRFDSEPSGSSVIAAGRAAELCRTPCTFHIDLSDGGPVDRRTYAITHDGFATGVVSVDLTSNKRAYSVALEPADPPTPIPAATPTPAAPAPVPDHPRHRPTHTAGHSAHVDASKDVTKDAAKDSAKQPAPPPPPARDPDDGGDDAAPAAKKPANKHNGKQTIDPSDTLDPFAK